MKSESNYIQINREAWNSKTDIHLTSAFYNLNAFLNGKNALNDIELGLLGEVRDKRVLHLQCHFGLDTLSLSRLGAKATGIDFSEKAIERAEQIATLIHSDARFICCDVYDLPNYIHEEFDIVYTSYGTIGWLPDLDKWANIISRFLKPNGLFIFVEFHPVVWMFDDEFTKIQHRYFNSGVIQEIESGTYADRNAAIKPESITWNHGISEVLNSLLKHELSIESFDEYDYSPYNCFLNMVEFEPGKYQIRHLDNKIPMVYAIKAVKSGF